MDDSTALDQNFYDRLTVALGERVEQCAPRVPVVTGKRPLFQTDTPLSLPRVFISSLRN